MSTITLNGDTSGYVNITVPSAAGANTVTFPAATGTVGLLTGSTTAGQVFYGGAVSGTFGQSSNLAWDNSVKQLAVIGNQYIQYPSGGGTYGTVLTLYSGGGDVSVLQGTSGSGFGYVWTGTNHALAFGTNGSEKARLDIYGSLLVGTTTSPTTTTGLGTISTPGTVVMGSSFKRNRIINGNMVVDQRNAGASVTINSAAYTYTVDRWAGYGQSAKGVYTVQQSTTAPNNFTNSALITVTTASTPSGSDLYGFRQAIEGFNFQDVGWGTSAAQNVTMSFWVKSSLTGTFGGSVFSNASSDAYPFTYTIGDTNWNYITVTIPARTTGTFQTGNNNGLNVWFNIGGGTTATANAWNTTNTLTPAGATNIIATNGATFYITGVQLEVGSVATPYERQIFSDQLAQCQRYYEKSFPLNTAPADAAGYYGAITSEQFSTGHNYLRFPVVQYKVVKRTQATVTFYNPNIVSATYKAASENPASTTVNATIGYRTNFSWDECFFPLLDGGVQTTNNAFEVWCSNWTAAAEL